MARPTVVSFSAWSSGMSSPNSSSSAMTSSTVSRESAPRSSMKDASSVTCSSLMLSLSETIARTFLSSSSLSMVSSFANSLCGRRPSHVHAAVHTDHLARDVRGLLGEKEFYRRCHVFGKPEFLEGDEVEVGLADLLGEGVGHGRGDEPRGHGVDRDAADADLAGKGLGERDDRRLGGRVVGLAGVAHEPG